MTDVRQQLESLRLQADDLRARVADMERELARQRVQGQARDGAITVTATGLGKIVDVDIEPGLIGRTPAHALGQLVVAAVGDARAKAAQLANDASRALTTDGEPVGTIAPGWLEPNPAAR